MTHTIKKTRILGRIVVDYTAGPVYPSMVADLERATVQYGHLVNRGERLTGPQWLERIGATDDSTVRAIRTLMN